ncbi:MAG TPA: DUF2905 domain-containing protein [bacterium]|nr:DUF2905 domain-containing protein [bacterium]
MEKMLSRILLFAGMLFILTSLLVFKGIKIPFGRLPGDIIIRKENFSFYFPPATSVIISIILTVIFFLLHRR